MHYCIAQKALKEKEEHIEQLLVERDLERSELARMAARVDEVMMILSIISPFSSDRHHHSYDGCLEVRREIIRTVLCCIMY